MKMFKSYKFLWFILISFLFLDEKVEGQVTKSLTLKESLDIAVKKNYDLRFAIAQEDGAKADRAKSNSLFLPNLSLTQSYIATNDPLASFGFLLKQRVVSQSDFNPEILNNPTDSRNFTTRFEVQQPLFNPDALFGRLAAENAVSVAELKSMRAKYAVTLGVSQAYFQLALAQEGFQATLRALKAAEENLEVAKNFAEKGMMSKSDALMANVRFLDMQSKKADAELQVLKASENLALLLGMQSETLIIATDSLRFSSSNTSPDSLKFDLIRENRTDLQAMRFAVKGAERMTTMNLLSFVPRVNAFGSYELNDKNFFGFNANNWMLGVSLRWDIFKGFQDVGSYQKSRADLFAARAQSEKYERQSLMEFRTALMGYATVLKKYRLAEESLKQSADYLRIIRDRYEKGMEKTADVLNAEAMFFNVRLQELQSIYEHNLALLQLEYLSEQILTKN